MGDITSSNCHSLTTVPVPEPSKPFEQFDPPNWNLKFQRRIKCGGKRSSRGSSSCCRPHHGYSTELWCPSDITSGSRPEVKEKHGAKRQPSTTTLHSKQTTNKRLYITLSGWYGLIFVEIGPTQKNSKIKLYQKFPL